MNALSGLEYIFIMVLCLLLVRKRKEKERERKIMKGWIKERKKVKKKVSGI